jgi:hypothetical protein
MIAKVVYATLDKIPMQQNASMVNPAPTTIICYSH